VHGSVLQQPGNDVSKYRLFLTNLVDRFIPEGSMQNGVNSVPFADVLMNLSKRPFMIMGDFYVFDLFGSNIS
jgi:hypothetical protein